MELPKYLPKRLFPQHQNVVLAHLKTGEGRSKLIESMLDPARHEMDFDRMKYEGGKRTAAEATSRARVWIDRIAFVQSYCDGDGSETYDRTLLSNLVRDLKVFCGSLDPGMILDRHPDLNPDVYRGTGVSEWWEKMRKELVGKKFLGYWKNDSDPHLPEPQRFVDPTWRQQKPEEYEAVWHHLLNGKEWQAWRGYSWCRFYCGAKGMGTHDLSDGTYVWPEGFSHYIVAHDVKPPQEFIDHVMASAPSDP